MLRYKCWYEYRVQIKTFAQHPSVVAQQKVMKYQMQNNTARLQIHAHGTHNTSIMEYWNIKNGASICTNDLLLTFIQRTILGGSECDEGTNRGYRKEWEKWPEKKREVNRYAFEKWTKIKVQISHRQTNHKRYHPNWMNLSSLVLPSSLKSIKQKKNHEKKPFTICHCTAVELQLKGFFPLRLHTK